MRDILINLIKYMYVCSKADQIRGDDTHLLLALRFVSRKFRVREGDRSVVFGGT